MWKDEVQVCLDLCWGHVCVLTIDETTWFSSFHFLSTFFSVKERTSDFVWITTFCSVSLRASSSMGGWTSPTPVFFVETCWSGTLSAHQHPLGERDRSCTGQWERRTPGWRPGGLFHLPQRDPPDTPQHQLHLPAARWAQPHGDRGGLHSWYRWPSRQLCQWVTSQALAAAHGISSSLRIRQIQNGVWS